VKKEIKPKKINNQGGEKTQLDLQSFVFTHWSFKQDRKDKSYFKYSKLCAYVTNLKMLTAHIFDNVYLRSKLHIGERGEKARKEKKTLNLVKPLSPIERLGFTKLKEKKRVWT